MQIQTFGFYLKSRFKKKMIERQNFLTKTTSLLDVATRREGWLLPGVWSKMGKFIRPFMKSSLKRVFYNRK